MDSFRQFKIIAATAVVLGIIALSSQLHSGSTNTAPEGEALEQAALDFISWCGPCHGRTGRGDGPVAPSLRITPPNLTELSQRAGGSFPAESVRKRIDGRDLPAAHGSAEMPVWGYWFNVQATAAGLLQDDRETAEKEVRERIARLVAYLEAIQK